MTSAIECGSSAIPRLPTASSAVPSSMVVRAPRARESRAETGEKIVMAPPMGSSTSPAATSDSPNPYPVSRGACSTCVVTRKPANIEKPTSTDATFVQRTAGRALTRRSTSGSGVRSSQTPHAANSATAATSSPSTRADVQPHSEPLEIASSRHTSAVASPAAPGRSNRPPLRCGDSGTIRASTATAARP